MVLADVTKLSFDKCHESSVAPQYSRKHDFRRCDYDDLGTVVGSGALAKFRRLARWRVVSR